MAGLANANVKNNIILDVIFNVNKRPRNLAISRLLTTITMSERT